MVTKPQNETEPNRAEAMGAITSCALKVTQRRLSIPRSNFRKTFLGSRKCKRPKSQLLNGLANNKMPKVAAKDRMKPMSNAIKGLMSTKTPADTPKEVKPSARLKQKKAARDKRLITAALTTEGDAPVKNINKRTTLETQRADLYLFLFILWSNLFNRTINFR